MSDEFVTRAELQATIRALRDELEAGRSASEAKLEAQVQGFVREMRGQMTAFVAEVRASITRISEEARIGRANLIESNANVVEELRSMRRTLEEHSEAENRHRNQYDRAAQAISSRLMTLEEAVAALKKALREGDAHA